MPLLYTINRLAAIHIFGLIECDQQAPREEAPKVVKNRGWAEPEPYQYRPMNVVIDWNNQPIAFDGNTQYLSFTSGSLNTEWKQACGHKSMECFKKGQPHDRSYNQIIDKMAEKGFALQLSSAKGFYRASFVGITTGCAEADSLGLAVKVAALAALQVPDMEKHGED